MLTKWFKRMVSLRPYLQSLYSQGFDGTASPAVRIWYPTGKGFVEIKNTNGDIRYVTPSWGNSAGESYIKIFSSVSGNNGSEAYMIGSGTTPPTENDYNLETPITSGFSCSAPTCGTYYDENEGKAYRDLTYTITNTGETDLNINEIGYFMTAGSYSNTKFGTTSNGYIYYMAARSVLANTLVVPVGEASVLKVRWVADLASLSDAS